MSYGMGSLLTRAQRQQAQLDKMATANQIKLIKAQAAADAKLKKADVQYLPAQAAAQATVADSESTGKFVQALPWVLGGAVVLGGLYFILRKKGGSK